MSEDAELLRRYATDHSESAFAELIRRQVDLVYSAALRLASGDTHRAQDVTQQVFAELARQANHLTKHPALVGWLYTTARQIAWRANRTEQRRQAREQEAHTMNELLRESAPEPEWDRFQPVLDDAMHELNEEDRLAVLLRYFKNQGLKEVGQALGLNENAARMRVDRALDKLRLQLARQGVTSTGAALAITLAGNAVSAAPPIFVTTLTGASFAGTLLGTTIATTKAVTMTTLQKFSVTTFIAVTVGIATHQAHQAAHLRDEIQVLQQRQTPLTQQIDQLTAERGNDTRQLEAVRSEIERYKLNTAELLKLRAEVARLRSTAMSTVATDDSLQPETKQAIDRVNKLKRKLIEAPGLAIPELKFLDDADWIEEVEKNNLGTETDYLKALSPLRGSAIRKFLGEYVQDALKKYLKSNNETFPTDHIQLKPFFVDQTDVDLLTLYKVVPDVGVDISKDASDWIITRKSVPDEAHDGVFTLGRSSLAGTVPRYYEATAILSPALKALRSKFLQPDGSISINWNEVLPLLTPEQKAAYQKMMQPPPEWK